MRINRFCMPDCVRIAYGRFCSFSPSLHAEKADVFRPPEGMERARRASRHERCFLPEITSFGAVGIYNEKSEKKMMFSLKNAGFFRGIEV